MVLLTSHFEVGKRVVKDRKLFIILAYNGDRAVLVPAEESGYVEVVKPYYTQWVKR